MEFACPLKIQKGRRKELRGGWNVKLTIETVLSQGGETMKQRMLADATRLRKDSGFVLSYVEDETNTRVKV